MTLVLDSSCVEVKAWLRLLIVKKNFVPHLRF